MGALGDVKDIAVLAALAGAAYLILNPRSGRGVGETIVGGGAEAVGSVIAGGFAKAQSLVTGQPTSEIYEHTKMGVEILNEWANNIFEAPSPLPWSISGGGLSIGTVE